MIQICNLKKSYTNKVLFTDVNLTIEAGAKIGFIARNGYGKSTLLKIISGVEQADEGYISFPKNYKVGMLRQKLVWSKDTVLEEAISHLADPLESWKAKKILSQLGFTEKYQTLSPSELSSGFQLRLELANLLLEEPDLLCLDEPTNYLDILSIRFLKKFLAEWKKECILVSHDREFLDSSVNMVMTIHRGKLKKIQGKTKDIYEQIAHEEEIYEKTRKNELKEQERIENFIRKFRSKATLASRVQSRIKTLEKRNTKEKLTEIENLEFTFPYKTTTIKHFLGLENLAFGYEKTKLLFSNLNMDIYSEDKVAIIGKNGKGKTTLLKLLSHLYEPLEGNIEYNSGVEVNSFFQDNYLHPENSIEDELFLIDPLMPQTHVRNIAANMLFTGDEVKKQVKLLSGGEYARVCLAKMLLKSSNLLLLDEPTNHLDMDACDSLIEALLYFKGPCIFSSHNELLLRAVATKLIVFEDDRVFVFNDGYDAFLEQIGWKDEAKPNNKEKEKQNVVKLDRKERGKLVQQKNKLLTPLNLEIKNLEKELEDLENQKEETQSLLIKSTQDKNAQKIKSYSLTLNDILQTLDEKYILLETLYQKVEEIEERFKPYF